MKRWKSYLIIISVLLLLIIAQFRNPEISGPYKGIVGNVLNPFVYMVNRAGSFVSESWSNYIWLTGVARENQELSSRLGALMLENAVLSERLIQFENLDRLLNYRDAYAFETVAANVVGRNVDGYMKYIIIDRGSKDGVMLNDPVVSSEGLVGRVNKVYHSTSEVILLHHHDSSVSVINSRTRAVGILKGDGKGGLFVDFYDRLDDARPDDVMITSGMGQLFPKGINTGKIISIEMPKSGLFQILTVENSVDFYKLEQVLVVKQKYADTLSNENNNAVDNSTNTVN